MPNSNRPSGREHLITVGQSLFFRFSALALGAILLFVVGYAQFGLRPVVLRLADGQFNLAANQVVNALVQIFKPVEDLLGIAGKWSASPDFSVKQPDEFNRLFRPILLQVPQVTSVVAGTSDGRGWLLLRLPDNRWHNRITDPEWGSEHLFIEWKEGSAPRQERRSFEYDPRARPWFEGAISASSRGRQTHWTSPYAFLSTKEPGITASARYALPDGRDLVIGFDIKLIDLSRTTTGIRVSKEGCVLVMTADGRMLGLPGRIPFSDHGRGSEVLLQPVEALPHTFVRDGVKAWRNGGTAYEILRFDSGGRPWLASFRPFPLGEQTFWVAIFAPESDFMPPWMPLIVSIGIIVLIVLGFSVMAARCQALRFSEPLRQLVANNDKIGRRDFSETPPVLANYKEFQQLAQSQSKMRAMLRHFRETLETQTFNLRLALLEKQTALNEKQAILDNALVGIDLLKDRVVIQHNRRASEILGYGGESIEGMTVEDFYPDRETSIATAQRIYYTLQKGENFDEELWLKRKDGSLFWARLSGRALDATNSADGSVWIVADLTDQKVAEEKLHYLGYYDSLTGMPNRHLFNDRLEQSIRRAGRQKEQIALLYIDIDRFKTVNDTLGHPFGDQLLCAVSQRLQDSLPGSETLARMSGDEFTLLRENVGNSMDVLRMADTLMALIAQPVVIDGRQVFMTASIGISIYPVDGLDGKSLLRNAETAMYRAKAQGRNACQFYSREMTQNALSRLEIEDSLRHALEGEGLELHFQPQVRLDDGIVTGAEALVRLRHPTRGLIYPGEFIPLAEESGLILRLGKWVLEESCHTLTALARNGNRLPRMAVNVSAKQLQREGFLEAITDILATAQIPPHALELEITESAFLESEFAFNLLRRIGSLGVTLSLDDFGTGYSSLSYLRRLPFQKLKIDKRFIQEIGKNHEGEALTRTIINLAQILGLEVIAEGVETREQIDFLLQAGCRVAQGYFFAKPMPATAFGKWLNGRNA